jgi:hypothetical protein
MGVNSADTMSKRLADSTLSVRSRSKAEAVTTRQNLLNKPSVRTCQFCRAEWAQGRAWGRGFMNFVVHRCSHVTRNVCTTQSTILTFHQIYGARLCLTLRSFQNNQVQSSRAGSFIFLAIVHNLFPLTVDTIIVCATNPTTLIILSRIRD